LLQNLQIVVTRDLRMKILECFVDSRLEDHLAIFWDVAEMVGNSVRCVGRVFRIEHESSLP
jgi:hypothetical protein